MKRTYILALLALMLTVSGCDFFRKVAGRPTSADIEAKKVAIQQARHDSLEALAQKARIAEEMAVRDSLAARDSVAAHAALKDKQCMMYNLSSLKGLSSGELDHRYYIIVGSFRDAGNAEKFIAKVAKEPGMEPVKVHFRTGMVAVGVCPRNRIADMAAVIDDVRALSFCPKDAWILVNAE